MTHYSIRKIGPQRWHVVRPDGKFVNMGTATSNPDELREYARELEFRIERDRQRVADLQAIAAHCDAQAAQEALAARARPLQGRERAAATRAAKKDPFGLGEAKALLKD